MNKTQRSLISLVVPTYNEASGLQTFHSSLIKVVEQSAGAAFEIIYCDDGSTDDTAQLVQHWHANNLSIKLIKLSRNFGKENALAAGIAEARGDAIIMLDSDGQHPVAIIPQFIKAWEEGAQVVVGMRTNSSKGGLIKHLSSLLFYKVFNKLTSQKLLAGSTDFRLIDKSVQEAFLSLKETDRITRGLIDWLGFRRQFIPFKVNPREDGTPGYNWRKLLKLAANSFVSLTPTPLYLFGYIGVFITVAAFAFGSSVFIEQLLLGDPWHWKFTGTAMLGILILFLVGIVLLSQGILSLYISHIHSQSKQRPLYVIDYQSSAGIEKSHHHAA